MRPFPAPAERAVPGLMRLDATLSGHGSRSADRALIYSFRCARLNRSPLHDSQVR